MKHFILLIFGYIFCLTNLLGENYTPTAENLAQRQDFQDMKFGLFIHWGIFSVLGDGEWVMNKRSIKAQDYHQLLPFFNPQQFDAKKWVAAAKNAGMKYITFITRHHDGFSNWDTQLSDWKITHTPYGRDVLKQLADECHQQGIKLFLYYSLLDWSHEDYPYETGHTGQQSGRSRPGHYESYLQFMKNQLTELLTQYGEIAGIWFDGHWDQMNESPEGLISNINWGYDEIYGLIHRLQPACLIGNNHHLSPFEGEDFQMFEKDLPGQNKSGFNLQNVSAFLPMETCETINNSWGFNMTDRHYKSPKELIQYLVQAAGRNTNFLLNIGPMPNGEIQPEFIDTLQLVGSWMEKYGETIYGTRSQTIPPQSWGVITEKGKMVYAHLLQITQPEDYIFIPGLKERVLACTQYGGSLQLRFVQQEDGVLIYLNDVILDETDTIIQLQLQ